ncbi:hypothetical protein KKF86_06280 [bacterium]|nr:hypothetical protein [bacterium]
MQIEKNKSKFSKKFYIGIVLIISSLIIGKITQAVFFFYYTDVFLRKLSIVVYVLSWPPFLLGIAWAGMEYADKYNRFFTFKYYKNKIRSRKK